MEFAHLFASLFYTLCIKCGGGGVLPHYTKGRQPGKYPSFAPFRDAVHPVFDLYDPAGMNKVSKFPLYLHCLMWDNSLQSRRLACLLSEHVS
jgi:hypothetical protein